MPNLRLVGLSGVALAVLVLVVTVSPRPTLRAEQTQEEIVAGCLPGEFSGAAELPMRAALANPPLSVGQLKVRLKLLEKVPMQFPNDTPLDTVLKYVRETTVDKADFPDGVPIYVNPVGLQDADKTPQDTVNIDLKGMPLTTTLSLVLDQLSLTYWVNPDGLVIITGKESDDLPGHSDPVADELAEIRQEMAKLRAEVHQLAGLTPGDLPADGPRPAGGVGNAGGMKGSSGGFR